MCRGVSECVRVCSQGVVDDWRGRVAEGGCKGCHGRQTDHSPPGSGQGDDVIAGLTKHRTTAATAGTRCRNPAPAGRCHSRERGRHEP